MTRPRRPPKLERLPNSANDAARNGSRKRRKRVSEGIYEDQYGLAATVKVKGRQQEVRFPPGTSLRTIQAERTRMKAAMQTRPSGKRQTLAHDAERYLDQVGSTLVSIKDRKRHIHAWLARFGHLRTLALPDHTQRLNEQLREWRKTLSASTCNLRRDALTNLAKVLYGRRAAADFVDLVRFRTPAPTPRWIDRKHISEVLHDLPGNTKTRVRLFLMHWTGMRPAQMGRLRKEDFRLHEPVPFVATPRGKRGKLAAIPLVGQGLEAAREFISRDAFGRWSCPSANKAIARAAARVNREAFTVYQIRHSFAAALRRTGSDVADIQDLYGHTNPETTMIYAPPALTKHALAIERLHADETPTITPPTDPRTRFRLV